jgi:hypothetical protein
VGEEGQDLCSVFIFPWSYLAIVHEQSVPWLKEKEERKKVTRRRIKGEQQRNQERVKSVSRLIRYFTLL